MSLYPKSHYNYVLQLDGTLLWAWKFCRYSRIVVISAVVISEVDCGIQFTLCSFLQPRILAQPTPFIWKLCGKLHSETSLIQPTIHHSPLIWNYIVYVLSAASYKRFAGSSDIWTCKKTCFLNDREQLVSWDESSTVQPLHTKEQ